MIVFRMTHKEEEKKEKLALLSIENNKNSSRERAIKTGMRSAERRWKRH